MDLDRYGTALRPWRRRGASSIVKLVTCLDREKKEVRRGEERAIEKERKGLARARTALTRDTK